MPQITNLHRRLSDFYYEKFPAKLKWGSPCSPSQLDGAWNEDGTHLQISSSNLLYELVHYSSVIRFMVKDKLTNKALLLYDFTGRRSSWWDAYFRKNSLTSSNGSEAESSTWDESYHKLEEDVMLLKSMNVS
jgi:beta-glucosidase/6-phospho-beta-glucosidase/beta-galactosidase